MDRESQYSRSAAVKHRARNPSRSSARRTRSISMMSTPTFTYGAGMRRFLLLDFYSCVLLNGDPVADMGDIHGVVTLEPIGDRTRMTIMSTFEAEEQMEKIVAMGMEEGMREALGQVDAIIAESVNA